MTIPTHVRPLWIDITARDAGTLRDFYGTVFGWSIAVDATMDYGLLSTGPQAPPEGGIGQAGPDSPQRPGIVSYVEVLDVAEALERVVTAGGTTVLDPWEIPGLGQMALAEDPEGNRIGLMSRIPQQ